ncbi:MAG: AMP-binding protein [Gammaproteobacteria bacterium]|nr:AMP-binding protein [Gammaproteobacteria bacterium]MDE0478198.1 AMP-binding protein [Gammaproteobacteria bacterium]MYA66080.1 AMP-binding protein [Gammaproteobacteria bacterium]MYH45988.1 AMP-binding protein [Gammaproteobacteria bacterium]MYL14554.1 AMP-binding protein [Gammaproteobacteria bacterium]
MEKLPPELRPEQYASLAEVLDHVSSAHGPLPAFTCFGHSLTYREIDDLSNRLAGFLRNKLQMNPGDRIAIQLPNLLQFPVVVYAAIKADLVIVTTNPLYTAPEMKHQFRDSGAKAVVVLEAFCDKLESVIADTDIEHVVIARLGDLLPEPKRTLVNLAAKHLRKMIPAYELPGAHFFREAVGSDPIGTAATRAGENTALILYTGGTTGVAKGAMLTHRNLIANMMQLRSRTSLVMDDQSDTVVAPLPLYHTYAFQLHLLTMAYAGSHNILVPNPRDLDALVKLLRRNTIHGFAGINTLYLALLRHPKIGQVDFSTYRFCGAGGMAMSSSIAEDWQELTGCEILEGYGLTECSPVVAVNIPGEVRRGTVGKAVPETELRVVDDEANELPIGSVGELQVRGPQVMAGYYGREEATQDSINADGWFSTGDYVNISEDGYISIVDRKKDMILVSGFNVFPNEIEDWVNRHPQVIESAAIGVPDERTGEAVKLFVVAGEEAPGPEDVQSWCRQGLAAYKIPRKIEFVEDLPKSNIGKILRRELRE